MLRTFKTHKIRLETELSGLWQLKALGGRHIGRRIKEAVPCSIESIPGYENFKGRAVHETSFYGGGNLRLVFKGVSHTAQVFVDDMAAGAHYGSYTPFNVLMPALGEKEHVLRVISDSAFNESVALDFPNDYSGYSGITRPVAAQWVPECFIDAVHITPGLRGNIWTLDINIRLRNIGADTKIVGLKSSVDSYEYDFGQVQVEGGSLAYVSGRLACPGVRAYELDAPVMYMVNSVLYDDGVPVDDLIERIGFRELRVSGKDILFNGKPIRICGFNRHEDHPQFGCSLPLAAMQYDIALMKEMGANAVRTSHYPNDELFLDLCDEQGILVWEESHARGLSLERMQHPNFKSQSEACINEMIDAHFNHPSIFVWGILNECASDTAYGRQCYDDLFKLIRKLDPSRPVSFASCHVNSDICLDLVDIVSFNCYPRWYSNVSVKEYMDGLYAWVQTTGGRGKPFLVTETGAEAIYGNRSPGRQKWSEERQSDIINEQLGEILMNPNFSGVYIWQFCDAKVSEEWFSSRPRSMNNKGIVDEYRRPKLASAVVQKHFKRNK